MRKFTLVVLLVAVLVSCTSFQASASESLAVAYVDVDAVGEKYETFKQTLAEIETEKEQAQKELDELTDTFDRRVRKFELQEGLWESEEAKQQEMVALQNNYKSLQEFKMKKDMDLEARSREKLAPLFEKINGAVELVARQSGYHLVFRKRDLIYADPRLDITDAVVTTLNQE